MYICIILKFDANLESPYLIWSQLKSFQMICRPCYDKYILLEILFISLKYG